MSKIRNFMDLLRARWVAGFFVCIGLDSDHGKIPAHVAGDDVEERIFNFNKEIIDETWRNAGAYKLNYAFYLNHDEEGIAALVRTVRYIHIVAPGVPVILDTKSADIDNTNIGYVQFVFNVCEADAITVHNYMGRVAMLPFLEQKNKGVIVLCKTSNKGSGEFQDLIVKAEKEGEIEEPLYCRVARNVAEYWNTNGNCALVVGATYPAELARVRAIVGNMPILIPGIGAQGGDVRKSVRAGMDRNRQGIMVNSSRGIIFKSAEPDFAEVALRETIILSDMINEHRLDDNLTEEEVLEIFKQLNAWMKDGHYVYTSGNHGTEYLNKDGIYPWVSAVALLCRAIAARYRDKNIEVVVGPEKGAIILSTWVAYFLEEMTGKTVHAVFAEKCADGFCFKRGYEHFVNGKRALIVEDILNTGGSAEKTKKCTEEVGGEVVDICGLVDRGGSGFNALARVHMDIFPAHECSACAKGIPVNTDVGKGAEYLAKKETDQE